MRRVVPVSASGAALIVVALLTLCVVGCSSSRPSIQETRQETPNPGADGNSPTTARFAPQGEAWPVPIVPAALERCSSPLDLEVGVVVFGSGIENPDERDARHKLRSVETRLAATTLRDVMTDSGCWGPVRVLPSSSRFAALTITGTIVHSDGRDLILDIQADDASGRLWLDDRLRISVTEADYTAADSSSGPGPEPFLPLFANIANRLYGVGMGLQAERGAAATSGVLHLQHLARLRYAAELVPDAFADYLGEVEGRVVLQRLPAADDPMLARIDRVRNQEALFIDTVDEQYVDLRAVLGPTYRLWRRSSFEQAEYLDRYTERAAERELKADRGSYAAMQQVYSTYRSVRIQEQDMFELATGFDNETAATVMDSGDRVVRLSGTLDEQYHQWRDILARIIRLERGTL